jgi:polysaccharide pyruvyl transferase WcaK-like protein
MNIVQIGVKVGPQKGVGLGNAGDSAIGGAFNFLFEKEFEPNNVDFINCRKIYTKEDVNFINQHDVLFLSGGGLFLYDTFPNDASDWQWGISSDLLDMISIPIVVYALGYNKFRKQRNFNKLFDKTVNKLVEKAAFFSLRNSGSCKSIKDHIELKNHKKIHLNFCPTMILNDKFQFKHQKNTDVGFVIAGDRVENRHQNLDKFINHMSEFVNYLKKKGIRTVLINHQNDDWIKKYIDFDKEINLFGVTSDCIYETYASIDTVICDRGHAQMIPFSLGCKIISPISHNKLGWFLKDMEIEEFGIEENDAHLAEKLIAKYEKLSLIDWTSIHKKQMKKVYDVYSRNMLDIKKSI